MRLRKDVLKESSRAEVRWMYKQTLWCPDIFPSDSITKLRNLNNNTIDVPTILGLTRNLQQNNNSNGTNNVNNNSHRNRHQNKRQRTDVQQLVHTIRTNIPQNTNNSRVNQTQKANHNNANSNSNTGPNNGKQSHQHNKGQGSKGKKSFPKKRSGNTQ